MGEVLCYYFTGVHPKNRLEASIIAFPLFTFAALSWLIDNLQLALYYSSYWAGGSA